VTRGKGVGPELYHGRDSGKTSTKDGATSKKEIPKSPSSPLTGKIQKKIAATEKGTGGGKGDGPSPKYPENDRRIINEPK